MAREHATIHIRQGEKVRIGPITVITLIAIICMAVLAVLTVSTSHASAAISERQANATQLMFLNECAGQKFVAGVDEALAPVRETGGTAEDGAKAVDQQLDSICQQAREAADGRVDCIAKVDGTTVTAEFICENTRQLIVTITINNDATYRIQAWKMVSVQQEAPPAGTLWQGG